MRLVLVGVLLLAFAAPARGEATPAPSAPETKTEAAKPDLAKPDPAKPDPAKPDPAKPDPAKPDPAKPDPAKADPAKPDADPKADAAKTDPLATDPLMPADLNKTQETPPDDLDFGWMLIRTLIVLAIVVGLIYLSLNFGLRKLMGIRPVVRGGAQVVEVLERVTLDNKHGMYVVKAAGEYLLIGGGEGNLNLLVKLDAAEVERLRQSTNSATLQVSPLLQRLLSRSEPTKPSKGTPG